LDEDCFIDDVLSNVLSGDKLSMAVVDNFVNDFVNEHEVFADALFVEHTAVVSEYLHHAVKNVEHCTRLHVVFGRGHEVNPKFLREKVIHAVYIECRWWVSGPELHLAEEDLTRLAFDVKPKVSFDDGIATC